MADESVARLLLADNQLPPPPLADSLDELNPYAVEARYGLVEPEGLDRTGLPAVLADVRRWAEAQISRS